MDAENTEIRRTVTLTVDDVVAANQLFARRWRGTSAAWVCPAIAGLVAAFTYLGGDQRLVGIVYGAGMGIAIAVAAYLLIWLFQIASIPVSAARTFRETAGMGTAYDYVLTSKALSYDQEDSAGRRAWHTLTRWSLDQNCLILFNTRLTFYVLPRRTFGDEEVARIEGWLTQAGVPRY